VKGILKVVFIFISLIFSNTTLANDHTLITKDNIPYLYESRVLETSISSLLSSPDRPKNEFERKKRLSIIYEKLKKYKKIQNIKYSLILKLGEYDFEKNSFKFPLVEGSVVKVKAILDEGLRQKLNPIYLGTDYYIRFNIADFEVPMNEEDASTYVTTHNRLIKVGLFGTINSVQQSSSKKSTSNFFSSGSTSGYEIRKTLSMQVNRIVIMDTNNIQLLDKKLKK